jgi:hypothetical protein
MTWWLWAIIVWFVAGVLAVWPAWKEAKSLDDPSIRGVIPLSLVLAFVFGPFRLLFKGWNRLFDWMGID